MNARSGIHVNPSNRDPKVQTASDSFAQTGKIRDLKTKDAKTAALESLHKTNGTIKRMQKDFSLSPSISKISQVLSFSPETLSFKDALKAGGTHLKDDLLKPLGKTLKNDGKDLLFRIGKEILNKPGDTEKILAQEWKNLLATPEGDFKTSTIQAWK